MAKKKGGFICFMGIDGSGKTTHALGLKETLNKRKLNSMYVRPRYELLRFIPPRISKLVLSRVHIRPVLVGGLRLPNNKGKRHARGKVWTSYFLLLYAMFSYWLTIRRYSRRTYLVCDRYFFDWFFSPDKCDSLTMARFLPKPDLVFLMDIPVSLAYSRMKDVEDTRIPQEYYESLRTWYLTLARIEGFITIDSTEGFERVRARILEYVLLRFGSEE